jgi:aspartate/methionine/tyrosine aminotransferase
LSKTFGLAGLRTGWLATRDAALLDRCQVLKDYTTICQCAPGELLAIVALEARERIVAANRLIVRANLDAARSYFDSRGDLFTWIEPGGGSVAFPAWKGPAPVEDFCRDILRERSVVAVAGSLFEFPGSHFRVGLGRRNLPEVLDQVAEFCRAAYS